MQSLIETIAMMQDLEDQYEEYAKEMELKSPKNFINGEIPEDEEYEYDKSE